MGGWLYRCAAGESLARVGAPGWDPFPARSCAWKRAGAGEEVEEKEAGRQAARRAEKFGLGKARLKPGALRAGAAAAAAVPHHATFPQKKESKRRPLEGREGERGGEKPAADEGLCRRAEKEPERNFPERFALAGGGGGAVRLPKKGRPGRTNAQKGQKGSRVSPRREFEGGTERGSGRPRRSFWAA